MDTMAKARAARAARAKEREANRPAELERVNRRMDEVSAELGSLQGTGEGFVRRSELRAELRELGEQRHRLMYPGGVGA